LKTYEIYTSVYNNDKFKGSPGYGHHSLGYTTLPVYPNGE